MAKSKGKKKTVKRAAAKKLAAKTPPMRASTGRSEAVTLDPIAAALLRRRQAMLSR